MDPIHWQRQSFDGADEIRATGNVRNLGFLLTRSPGWIASLIPGRMLSRWRIKYNENSPVKKEYSEVQHAKFQPRLVVP
jgi:hypothetical protein